MSDQIAKQADQLSGDGNSVLLSLCMIVRDNETIIGDCLESIKPWVDEMIVVDTGAVDQTPQIAKSLGAKVYHFPWCDDFSAARNESLKYAIGKWVFWMDSDDTIDPENGRKLRELVSQDHPANVMAHVMQVHCPGGPESPNDCTVVDHVKVFRNHPSIRFEGRIHEQLLSSIRALGGGVGWTDIFVVHSGSDQSETGKAGKYERDLRCLKLDLQERPGHPFVLFNLGMTYSDMEHHEEALDWLRQCLEASTATESHVRKAFALLVHTLHQLGRDEEAYEECRKALLHFPEDPELQFRFGIVAHGCQRLPEAIEAYQQACSPRTGERYFASLDPSISGYKARFNLGLVYIETEQYDLAELQFRYSIGQSPKFASAWRKLGEVLLTQDKRVACSIMVEEMLADSLLQRDGHYLQGLLLVHQQEFDEAWSHFEDATEGHAQQLDVWQSLSRFLFDHARPEDAQRALLRLIELCPNDGACFHNLGLVYRMMNLSERAFEAFERSLELRPDAIQTMNALRETQQEFDRLTKKEPSSYMAPLGG